MGYQAGKGQWPRLLSLVRTEQIADDQPPSAGVLLPGPDWAEEDTASSITLSESESESSIPSKEYQVVVFVPDPEPKPKPRRTPRASHWLIILGGLSLGWLLYYAAVCFAWLWSEFEHYHRWGPALGQIGSVPSELLRTPTAPGRLCIGSPWTHRHNRNRCQAHASRTFGGGSGSKA